ncbi:MAG: uncharacterized protein JWN44_1963 [Myxococcales bacterium]|nr:uncharacterized protein [Myxococcales bacterium]
MMAVMRLRTLGAFALAVLPLTAIAKSAPKPEASLGRIEFPVTGSEESRRHFLRGMLAMHSFWYEEARDEFRAATATSPTFAMGYWGEALTHYHPVWGGEDLAASRAVMAKLPTEAKLTEREQGFIEAARLLFGEGDRQYRWTAYATALRNLHKRYPADDEAAVLYAVALLGEVTNELYDEGGKPGFRRYAEAGAIALDVLAHNPDHPGAAHYVIHAFDDTEHAILALPAARRYGKIAPEASHALHMPSHTFVQLGMWPEAEQANDASWAASDAWVRRKKIDPSYHDHHTLAWLEAVSLEQGKRRKAYEVVQRALADVKAVRDEPAWMRVIYLHIATDYLIESDDWSRLDELIAPLATREPSAVDIGSSTTQPPPPTCHPAAARNAKAQQIETATLTWLKGVAALARKDAASANRFADALAKVAATMEKHDRDGWRGGELELRGRAAALRGDEKAGIAQLRAAIALEERTPPTDPVQGVTARERLGDILLAGGHAKEALEEYRRALEMHPRRGRALWRAAQAATAANDSSASAYWSELGVVWQHADADQPGLDELHRALASKP